MDRAQNQTFVFGFNRGAFERSDPAHLFEKLSVALLIEVFSRHNYMTA